MDIVVCDPDPSFCVGSRGCDLHDFMLHRHACFTLVQIFFKQFPNPFVFSLFIFLESRRGRPGSGEPQAAAQDAQKQVDAGIASTWRGCCGGASQLLGPGGADGDGGRPCHAHQSAADCAGGASCTRASVSVYVVRSTIRDESLESWAREALRISPQAMLKIRCVSNIVPRHIYVTVTTYNRRRCVVHFPTFVLSGCGFCFGSC